jgi:hypothetical protein
LNQRAKQPGSGGPSGQEWRTARTGHADYPPRYRGLSARVRWTVRPGPRTVRKIQQNLQQRTPKNGLSAGSTRTVRQAPADCPCLCCGPSETSSNQNSKPKQIESEAEQEHEEHSTNTALVDRPPQPCGLFVPHGQRQKLLDPEGQLPQLITESPKWYKLLRQGFGDMISIKQGCYTPKPLPPNSLNHRELRIL